METFGFEASRARVGEASFWLAGGVSSNFRQHISPTPLVFSRGEGARLLDADGNWLIDYYLGMGPMILGHRPAEVVAAVRAQLDNGILFGGQSELEFEAAEKLCAMVPCAARVRFGSSGTEMVQAALRLSRAATNRSRIIKFHGHYHGWLDNVLWGVPSSAADAPAAAGSLGQDPQCGREIEVLRWNDADLLTRRLAGGDVAAVIMEPVMCNAGVIPPAEGFLEAARAACDANGSVLIFDEVITGFRLGPAGAQGMYGVTPDLAVFGKAIASGFPVACLAGRADLMDLFTQGVLHGGTYNAQPVSMAATVATLECLSGRSLYVGLEERGRKLMEGITSAMDVAGMCATVTGFPQVFHVALGLDAPPRHYGDLAGIDRSAYVKLTEALLRRGVRALERGVWFTSSAHDDGAIEVTLAAFGRALADLCHERR